MITCKTSVISGIAGIGALVTLVSFVEMRINHKVNKERGEPQLCFYRPKIFLLLLISEQPRQRRRGELSRVQAIS